jgi:FHA domain
MIRCQTCGTESPAGSQYCDECGGLLNSSAEIKMQPTEISRDRQQIPETPIFQSTNVTSYGVLPIDFEPLNQEGLPTTNGSKSGAIYATLVIERGESAGTEFSLAADESNIGRWDADNGIFPDVDLDKHDPEAKISRRHARILRQDGKFLIEDLGSTNGTFVNRGRRLLPGNKNILNDGDEIIIGKTFLRFNLND